MTEAFIIGELVLLSLAYCISCTRWASCMSRKAKAVQRWTEAQQAAEALGYGNRRRGE